MARFYRATFRKQLTGTDLGPFNCGAASGAMLVDQATLHLKRPTPDAFRKMTNDLKGGLFISTTADTLEKYGVLVDYFDGNDGLTFDRLVAFLRQGRFAVVCGDYDVVPRALTGSDTFDGLHSEFWHAVTSKGIVVGDPLNDGRRLAGSGRVVPKGYVTYPMAVAREYVEKFDRQVAGRSIHAAVMERRRLRSKSGVANVRSGPSRRDRVIGTLRGTSTLAWGGVVRGESIGGNSVWFRVWLPTRNVFAYCHSSVVQKV